MNTAVVLKYGLGARVISRSLAEIDQSFVSGFFLQAPELLLRENKTISLTRGPQLSVIDKYVPFSYVH